MRPAVLAGHTNGQLPSSILVDTPGLAGGQVVRLVEPAARAWRVLTAAASAAGHTLKPTSLFDSYRPYEVQERIFRQRYTTTVLAGRPRRWWDPPGPEPAAWWYQRPDTAPAAVPGTSNHGWALAVDVGEERDGDTGTESIDLLTLQWLVEHELEFGFSHELQVETWHIRYWTGDAIPAAVLAFEEDDMPLTNEDVDRVAQRTKQLILGDGGVQQLLARVAALVSATDPVPIGAGQPNVAAQLWRAPAPASPPADLTELAAELTALREAVAALPEAVADEQHDRQAE